MGKNKQRPGKAKGNAIFKVVGGKAGKNKGKPQEVNTKLKNINTKKTKAAVNNLDQQFTKFQSGGSIKINGTKLDKNSSKIEPVQRTDNVNSSDLDSVIQDMNGKLK